MRYFVKVKSGSPVYNSIVGQWQRVTRDISVHARASIHGMYYFAWAGDEYKVDYKDVEILGPSEAFPDPDRTGGQA